MLPFNIYTHTHIPHFYFNLYFITGLGSDESGALYVLSFDNINIIYSVFRMFLRFTGENSQKISENQQKSLKTAQKSVLTSTQKLAEIHNMAFLNLI